MLGTLSSNAWGSIATNVEGIRFCVELTLRYKNQKDDMYTLHSAVIDLGYNIF